MSPELDAALVTLVIFATITLGLLNIFLVIRMVPGSKVQQHKVELTNKAEDNIFTKSAAAEHAKAAEANERAANTALETAKVNQRTEEARLERARLEKSG